MLLYMHRLKCSAMLIITLQLLLDTGFSTLGREADDDFTTQFLHSPMFDSLREKVNKTTMEDGEKLNWTKKRHTLVPCTYFPSKEICNIWAGISFAILGVLRLSE